MSPSEAGTLVEAAPAKVNLALHVRCRRADDYHDLETIFAFTEFGDTLTGAVGNTERRAPEGVQAQAALNDLTLTVAGEFAATLGEPDDLVLRAARALAATAGVSVATNLRLTKRIPVAAGLGGGSADAAATLRLLNRLWKLDWPPERLAEVGSQLGADVPACVYGTPQVGRGRGEQLVLYPGASFAATPILLVNPRIAMPTGPVFTGWDGVDQGALDPTQPLRTLRNDLTGSALTLSPVVETVLTTLDAAGASLSRMSGSGATCFGLFDDMSACAAACERIASAFPGWWMVATTLR